jgi:predicted mannosyl-3-phosphoglycerate phosphatase (HAD superfamily)
MTLRSTSVVFCAIDNLIGLTNKALTGFPEFLEGLAEADIPLVPVTGRGRLQIDATLRKFDLGHPFIAEGGCGVYMPEDYFHLKPPRSVRMGRFTCIPQAAPQPAAAEILDTLHEETGIEVVALRGLSPRELSQNVGLPQRDAELVRQRDFDELFFFAGASDDDILRFQNAALQQKAQMRRDGAFWSLASGANLAGCMKDLAQLYQRSFRANPVKIGIATTEEAAGLFPSCDRCLLLTGGRGDASQPSHKGKSMPLYAAETWPNALEAVISRQL